MAVELEYLIVRGFFNQTKNLKYVMNYLILVRQNLKGKKIVSLVVNDNFCQT